MRGLRKLIILALAVCMLWGMTSTALAASSDEAGETSTFAFTNEGTTEGTEKNPDSGSDGTPSTTSTPSGTSGSTGSGSGNGSGSASGAKTADVNTGAYVATVVIAGAGVAALLGVTGSRKRRMKKEGR